LVELLKLVPGLNVGAMVISGTTAAFLTIALGLSYLEVIVKLTRENLLGLDPCRIQEMVIQGTKETLSNGAEAVMARFGEEKAKVADI